MRSNIIHETRRFTCTSYGNGLAYALERRLTRESVLFQGDDAHSFREELDKLTARRLRLSHDDALGILWNDYQEVAQTTVPGTPSMTVNSSSLDSFRGLEMTICAACGRDEADCSADPCASVVMDRLS